MISYCWWCQQELQLEIKSGQQKNFAVITMICKNHPDIHISYSGFIEEYNTPTSQLYIDHASIRIYFESICVNIISVYFTDLFVDSNTLFYHKSKNEYNTWGMAFYKVNSYKVFSQPLEKTLKIFDMITFI